MFKEWAEKFREKTGFKDDDIEFKNFEVETETITPEPEEEAIASSEIKASSKASNSNIELKVVNPTSFMEVSAIADYLLDGCTVVLNIEGLEKGDVLRMLDFLNGVTYSNDGEIKKVAANTYIITPHYVDIE
jgi:cell division inhibitor SepF